METKTKTKKRGITMTPMRDVATATHVATECVPMNPCVSASAAAVCARRIKSYRVRSVWIILFYLKQSYSIIGKYGI